MSVQPTNSPPAGGPAASRQHQATADDQQLLFPIHRNWKIASVIAAIMVLLTLLGVALTTSGRSAAPPYWISLAPIFGVLCAATAWARHRHAAGLRRNDVIRQSLHWLGVAVALGLDFVVRNTGEETGQAAGLNAMLLLALGCFLAGVHLEWHFAIVGVLLCLALLIVAKAEQYVWLIFVVGVLAVAGLLGARWLLLRGRQPALSAPAVASTVPPRS
jgi:Ni/Fe-hydrogenase subunit HybB-like protein